MTLRQCETFLRRHHVARIAYRTERSVDIEPIHYVYRDGVIVMRTSEGAKLEALRHSPWIALEVDEAEGIMDWRSVVVHGAVYAIDDGPPSLEGARDAAMKLLRQVVPETGRPDDPFPWRTTVMHMVVDDVTGREARSAGKGEP
jgi:hypothetical protein